MKKPAPKPASSQQAAHKKTPAAAGAALPKAKKVQSKAPAGKRTLAKSAPRSTTAPSAVLASGVASASGAQAFDAPISPVMAGSARSTKPLLLWIGDALVPTGFATVTHSVLDHLRQDWDVVVSGVNYDGSPHGLPYRVMPAWQGGDMWGMNRFQALCAEFAPAAVVINND